MKLIPIPKEKYEEYRRTLMFDCYKWDPQFLDHNTIAPYALVISRQEQAELARLTEQLDAETRKAEEFLNEHQKMTGPLALPGSVRREIKKMNNYDARQHVRLMRYDFHPTSEGKWAVSEVNSDVPGGFAESSLMPLAAMKMLEGAYHFRSFGEIMVDALANKMPVGGRIMMVHCTCYSDDRQVMQYLGDRLEERGFRVIYGAADHLQFSGNRAYSILDGKEGRVDAIFRFTPLEWLTEIKPKRWQGYFDTTTLSCNHPIAMYAQTKRFPLIWDALEKNGISMSTWKELLPDTLEVRAAKGKEGYIFKPACGRVGEKISIQEACSKEEYQQIIKDVKRHPKKYLAQKRFHSKPLMGENGQEFHVCLGSYAVDGKHAGFYARISDTPRIDSNAADIPVLVEGSFSTEKAGPAVVPGENEWEKTIYNIWAPAGKSWVDWVRPVAFVEMKQGVKGYCVSERVIPLAEEIRGEKNTVVIVDLPGGESVFQGIALAERGFRPVPVFNGTMEQEGVRATVNNQSVGVALVKMADRLKKISLAEDAPPAFLTDKNRLQRYKLVESVFDNSWDVYPQDLPSASYMKEKGIRKIVVISTSFSEDLKKVLYKHQKSGIDIYFTKGYEAPKRFKLHKPLRKEE